jgi:hypothetical protein
MTRSAETLMTPELFEAVMPYFLTREGGQSKQIAFAHYVLGYPSVYIMEKVGTTKQNIVRTLARFAEAYDKYQQAQRNLASASPSLLAEYWSQNDTTFDPLAKPVVAKKVATKKAAAKKVTGSKPAGGTKAPK